MLNFKRLICAVLLLFTVASMTACDDLLSGLSGFLEAPDGGGEAISPGDALDNSYASKDPDDQNHYVDNFYSGGIDDFTFDENYFTVVFSPGNIPEDIFSGGDYIVIGTFGNGTHAFPTVHDHTPEPIPGTAPTCISEGLTDGIVCTDCGEILVEQQVIPVTDHVYEQWIIDDYADWGSSGHRHAKCIYCPDTVSEYFDCSVGLDYESNGDGTCFVRGIGECTDTDIVVPLTYNGEAVVAVGSGAFENKNELNSVIIPDGVTEIGAYAFAWSSQITYIHIPESVESIGDSAFWYCFELADISIPAGITYIGPGSITCAGITSVSIDENNPYYYVSGNCLIEKETKTLIAGFGDIEIPIDGSVTSIAPYAFAGCDDLHSIFIPESVRSIGDSAFYCCGSLSDITFSEGLETIGYNAFNACDNLKTIVLPDSLTEIGASAFTWCRGIESVVIGSGVTNIYSGAFNQCSSLKNIYYKGSEEEWNNINIEPDWASNAGSFTVHFDYFN